VKACAWLRSSEQNAPQVIEGKPDHTGLVATETVQNLVRVYESLGVQFLETAETASGPGVALQWGGQD